MTTTTILHKSANTLRHIRTTNSFTNSI